MNIKIGFATTVPIDKNLEVDIAINNILITRAKLDKACSIQDIAGEMQYVEFDIPNPTFREYILTFTAHNMESQCAFQIRQLEIETVDIGFIKFNPTSYNPIDQGFMDYHIIPNHLEDKVHNGIFVETGEHANYVNMPNGYVAFDLIHPLYDWIESNNFGKIVTEHILN